MSHRTVLLSVGGAVLLALDDSRRALARKRLWAGRGPLRSGRWRTAPKPGSIFHQVTRDYTARKSGVALLLFMLATVLSVVSGGSDRRPHRPLLALARRRPALRRGRLGPAVHRRPVHLGGQADRVEQARCSSLSCDWRPYMSLMQPTTLDPVRARARARR